MMKSETTPLELLKLFVRAYFTQHDPKQSAVLVTDDLCCYGLANDAPICSRKALEDAAASDVHRLFSDSELTFEQGQQISEESAVVRYSLCSNTLRIQGHISGNARQTPEGLKLYFIHHAFSTPFVREEILRVKRTRIAEEPLESSVSKHMTPVTGSALPNDLLLHALSQNGTGIAVIDAQTHAVYFVNDTMFRMLGSEPFDYTNKFCPDLLAACGGSCANCGMHEVQEKEALDKTIQINGKWLSLHAERHQWMDQSVVSIYAVDMTDRIHLQNQLAATRTAINAAVQFGQLCLWSYDLTTRTVSHNLSDIPFYGYNGVVNCAPEAFVAKKIIHEADAEAYLRCYDAIQHGELNSECKVRVLSQSLHTYRWIHLYLLRQPDIKNANPMAVGISFDINREIEHLEAVSAAQERMQQEKQVVDDLFENLPCGIVMHRWDGVNLHPLYVSKGFSNLYGEDGEEMLKRTKGLDFDVVHPDDLPGLQAFILNNISKTNQVLFYRYRVFNQMRNDYIWIQLTGKVKRRMDGTLISYTSYTDVDAEVKAAQAVRREEELLEKTCHLAHIWIFHYNLQSKQVHLSKGLQADYNLPATIENYPDGFLLYPVIPAQYHALYRQMVQKVDAGEDATTEMPALLPDGTRHMIRFEWHITRQENGKTMEVAGLPVDITKEIAERKRINKERQRLLGGNKKLAAYSITDLQKETIVEARDYCLDSKIQDGDTCEAFNAKVAPLLLTESDRQRFLEIRNPKYAIHQYEAGASEWTQDMRFQNACGQIRWLRSVYSILENSYTGRLYLYSYLYDVTDDQVAQALFAGIQDNLYLRTAVLSFASGYIYDFKGDFANRQLNTLPYDAARKAYAAKHVLPEDADKVLSQNSLENIKMQLSSGQKDFSFTHRTSKDGTLHIFQVRYAMVPGKKDICIVVVRDITDLVKESEQKNAALQKALTAANEAAQTKSEFLSRMSHEIRTPMNAIMGMTAIARDNQSDFLQVSDCLAKIDSSSKYLLTLINDILEMSRIESGNAKLSEGKFDFWSLMDDICTVVEPLARKSEIRLVIFNHTANDSYYGDRIRIQQIMINLIGNAIKFTKPSGRVRFGVSALQDTPTKTIFEFTVEDTGIGMSETFMQKMFEPFTQEDATTTSQYGGSGLGLAISKGLVEAMGGTITAESMVGIGTNFTVQIPLEKAQSVLLLKPEKIEEIPEPEQDAILKGRRILMAEDHPLNVMVAKKLLERKGVLVTVAENGKIAVETFRSAAPDAYDAILMDIRMPVMDGLEATRQIRALDRPDAKFIPIIAMTANALAEDQKMSRAAGMDEHLAKPIEPKKLYQTLVRQIARKRHE